MNRRVGPVIGSCIFKMRKIDAVNNAVNAVMIVQPNLKFHRV